MKIVKTKEEAKAMLRDLDAKLVAADQAANLLPVKCTANKPGTEKGNEHPMLFLERTEDETTEKAAARGLTSPAIAAACTTLDFAPNLKEYAGINPLVEELSRQIDAVNQGDLSRPEAILMGHAQVLDAMFHRLAAFSASSLAKGAPDRTELYLRMALKAQAQCRTTIEALAEIKNPRQASFIKQQNIAQQQQVNNGVPMAPGKSSRERKRQLKSDKQTIGGSDGQRLDI